MTITTFSFGKHKGKDLEDIPSGYLQWLIDFHKDEEIVLAAEEEMKHRDDHRCHFED